MILVEKSESLRGYLRKGNSRHYNTAPPHKVGAVNQDEAANVDEKQNSTKKKMCQYPSQPVTNLNGDEVNTHTLKNVV